MVRIALPSKGRLREPAIDLLTAAGIRPAVNADRSLVVPTNIADIDVIYVRTEDIPSVVAEEAADLGITGYDYLVESGAEVVDLLDLGFGKARLVLAGISGAPCTMEGIPDGARVATKYVNITRRFFSIRGKPVKVVRVSGAAEIMPLIGVSEYIVDVVSTGTTMRIHGLKEIETVLETSARLIASKKSLKEEDGRIQEIVLAIKGVLEARGRKLVMMNVPGERLIDVLSILPGMAGPTVAKVMSEKPMWEVYAVVSEEEVLKTVADAKRRGARDILILAIEKVVP